MLSYLLDTRHLQFSNNLHLGVFDDDNVTHVEGDVNPVRDIEIIHEELRLKVGVALTCMKSPLYFLVIG